MRERDVEKYLTKKVKEYGGRTKKLTSQIGDVDRIVLWPIGTAHSNLALVHFVELKAPDGVRAEAQKIEHRRLYNDGFEVWVLLSKQQVDIYINTVIPGEAIEYE